jgi:hypothetical protein
MFEKKKKQSDYGLNALNTPLYGSKKRTGLLFLAMLYTKIINR